MRHVFAAVLSCLLLAGTTLAQQPQASLLSKPHPTMQVEIWSDIMCPFCYIGKRHLEQALAQFPHRDRVEVVWHSFQLDPTLKSMPGKSVIDYLAEAKGQTREWSVQAHAHVTQMAQAAGLTYNFDKAVVANSYDAHRVIQLAKTKGLGDAAEEAFFRAYFTEGKDLANPAVLAEIGASIGLDRNEVTQTVAQKAFTDAIEGDIYASRQINLRGVPHFVFNDRYAVSGAQPAATLLGALTKAFSEWEAGQPAVLQEVATGAACKPTGECD